MALVTSRTQLNQGFETAVSDTVFATGVGADIGIDSVGVNMPALAVGEFFEIRDHSVTVNNGLYVVVTINTTQASYEANKVSLGTPVVATTEATTFLGETGATTEKSVMFDTAALGIYVMEQGNVEALGVLGQAIYSFAMQEWKDDDFLIANGSFPILAIDTDAGKYIVGQNAAGENTGWNFVDVPGESIRTRKLMRNMGWDEVSAAGVTLARWFNATTLGTFEDPTNDNAFYQFGTDTVSDDTTNFTFNGPVNEAVQFFEYLADGSINGGTGIAISADGRTLTRSDGGIWRTDGFVIGGQITLRDSEDVTMDGTWLLKDVGTGIDGVVTCGRAADAASGLVITGTTDITRADGGSWVKEGWVVGSKLILTSSEDVGNDGTWTVATVSDTVITTTGLTNNADDTTMVCGMFDDALTPDILINASINNDNAVRLGIRVRDGDTFGKTFGEANLASAGKTVLGNFVFSFPLANATDQKIAATDGDIAGAPYSGMTITFHSTPQARAGLVGGSFNFGIIVAGNNGTGQEVFEFIQYSLRQLTDIDADADTAIGRSIGLLARFVGDTLEVGSGDGGLTFPTNPSGGGSGVYIDALNSVSANDVIFYDNLGIARANPETIAVTLDFNQVAIDDVTTEFDLFYDRTIRTAVPDMVLTSGTDVMTSATTALPNNAESGVGSYIRISGLTAGDAAMNGVYQILVETTPGASWTVVRYDGATIVFVAAAAVNADQHPFDTPDAIIVHTNVGITATTISFTAPDTIGDSGSGFGIFAIGDIIEVEGTPTNDGIYKVLTASATTLTTVQQTILTQGAGGSYTITKIVSGLADIDFTFAYDFDGNVQGGRTVSTTTFVVGKAIGSTGSQYIASPVQTISSGVPLTIPLFAQTERNYA